MDAVNSFLLYGEFVMTGKKFERSAFKDQNDIMLFEALQRVDLGWTAIHDVVFTDKEKPYLVGDEYLLVHLNFGIVLLDILPKEHTSQEAAEKLQRYLMFALKKTVPIHVLRIEHENIRQLNNKLSELMQKNINYAQKNDAELVNQLIALLKAKKLILPKNNNSAKKSLISKEISNNNFMIREKFYSMVFSLLTISIPIILFYVNFLYSSPPEINGKSSVFIAESDRYSKYSSSVYPSSIVDAPIIIAIDHSIFSGSLVNYSIIAAPIIIPAIPRPEILSLPPLPIAHSAPPLMPSVNINPKRLDGVYDYESQRSSQQLLAAQRLNNIKCRSIILRAQLGLLEPHELRFLQGGC